MRHLCLVCATLYVDQVTSGAYKTFVLRSLQDQSGPSHENVAFLSNSARGTAGTKACHLCALLLRSLKDYHLMGTEQEESTLPKGQISLEIKERQGGYDLFARTSNFLGAPIHISTGGDESCRGSDVSSSPCSDQVYSQINTWSNDCANKHIRCSAAKSSTVWLPSRVIDLGSPKGRITPRLLESHGSVGQYITLTHRWTSLTRESATTLANYQLRKEHIDTASLSITFQDAFEATHRLGVRYLWIDALCIIQDSSDDWSREASNMRSIYEFSWLNIAVAGSEKVDGRLFMERNGRINRPCKLPDTLLSNYVPSFQGPIYAYLGSEFYAKTVFDGFLTQRGWILQERILSSRTVYFGQEEVFWECSTCVASETIPWGFSESVSPLVKFNSVDLTSPNSLYEYARQPIEDSVSDAAQSYKIRKITGGLRDTDTLAPLYKYWYRLVEAYTKKQLTNPADRLPAIYGLAQALHKSGITHKIFTDSYRAGIWLTNPSSLLWYSSRTVRADINRVANIPSYSWASWNAGSAFIYHQAPLPTDLKVGGDYAIRIGTTMEEIAQQQAAILSVPGDSTKDIQARHIDNPHLLQIRGNLSLGHLSITRELPLAPLPLVQISGVQNDKMSRFASQREVEVNRSTQAGSLQPSLAVPESETVRSSFSPNEKTFRPVKILLDKYQEEALNNWLSLDVYRERAVDGLLEVSSANTVWALRLCILHQSDESIRVSPSPWATFQNGHVASHAGWYEFGLLLIPTEEDQAKIKIINDMLEPWNLPAPTKQDFEWERATSPPLPGSDKTRWMRAQERMKIHDLLGPHNAAFRRIGIYKTAFDYGEVADETDVDVLLA